MDNMENPMLRSLEKFQEAIDEVDNLEIVWSGQAKDGSGEILVVENNNIERSKEGHQSTVELAEIFAKVTDEKSAERMVSVINCESKAVVLEGVTRIVGYYSRTNNWNKSKIGELRDRAKGEYWNGANQKEHQEERLATIDAL